MLTIVYSTCRRDCRVEWFFDSLWNECAGDFTGLAVIMVDFHADERGRKKQIAAKLKDRFRVTHTAPKPSIWQGPHRLTKIDWFAACNMRNTGLCLAQDGYIAYADDLSVLLPGWLSALREAAAGNYIVAGAYKKVLELQVEDGRVIHHVETPAGTDSRLSVVTDLTTPSVRPGGWLYGCSCGFPIESLLTINGWPEDLCDGLGFEDCLTGVVLGNAGFELRYDPRMMTYESEELHAVEPKFYGVDFGVSPQDKSHKAQDIAYRSKFFPNSFGEGGIRALRERTLDGEMFPVMSVPDREWFTGTLLKNL